MGYFTKNGVAVGAGSPAPLTREAIEAVLDGWEAGYGVDGDGDVGGWWDGHLFWFLRGSAEQPVLTVRSRWNRELGTDQADRALAHVNAWHAQRIWPKAYVQAQDGRTEVHAELSVPLGSGVTHDQLDDLLRCALGTTLRLFEALDEEFPEAAAAAAEAARAEAEQAEAEQAGAGQAGTAGSAAGPSAQAD